MISRVARLLVLVALALAGWGVFKQYSARQVYAFVPGIEGALGALWWDPGRSNYHAKAGVLFRDDLESMDLERAVEHLERAVELNPYRSVQWIELARTYERLGRLEDAEQAYLQSVSLEQPSTDNRWEFANFLMRLGRQDESFSHLQRAVEEKAGYMTSALALLLRGGFDLAEIERAWPERTDSRMRLLELAFDWRENGRPGISHGEVVALWSRLLASDPPPSIEVGDTYVGHLFETGRHPEARQAWAALAGSNGQVDSVYAAGANDVWNGGFEHPLSDTTLAWHTWPGEGFDIARVPGQGSDGTAALRIDFHGLHNVNLANLQQRVLLEPGGEYEVEFKARTSDVTTEEGPRIEVLDPKNRRVLFRSDGITGTTDWATYSGSFTVPEDCGFAMIRAVRRPSRRIANRIKGTFWLDEVTLLRE